MKTGKLYKLLILAAAALLAIWSLGCSSSSNGGGGGGSEDEADDAGVDRGRTDGSVTDTGGTDTSGVDTGTPDIPVLDTGTADTAVTDTGGSDATAFTCSDLPPTSNDGDDCSADPSVCGNGVCVSLDEETGECADPCVLAGSGLPACEQHCTGDEVCVPLDTDPLPDGRQIGVCYVPPTGDVGEYGTCNATDLCQAGLTCVGTSATAGICMQTCDPEGAACTAFEGFAQECLLQLTDPETDEVVANACIISCDTQEDCPSSLTCTPVTGGSVCF